MCYLFHRLPGSARGSSAKPSSLSVNKDTQPTGIHSASRISSEIEVFEAGLMHGGWDSVFLYIFLTVPGRINPFRRQEVGITQACKPSQAVILVSRELLNDPIPSQFQGVVLSRIARLERCARYPSVGVKRIVNSGGYCYGLGSFH
jgi:hypothetical protein